MRGFLKIFVVFLCVYLQSCEGNKKLIVHIIPHSHNDAGWLMPFEKYYQQSTEKILTNVVQVLLSDQGKTFHWADIAFFNRWWKDQTDAHKEKVKQLVTENRFVFIGGGWVMNDEALPAYKESMAQMRVGLDFLMETFGVRPNIGWQIDPFGSSALTVSVLHKLGYSALVENRVSNDFKALMRKRDGYNFYWQGHQVDANKEEDRLFTHILQYFYVLPQVRFDTEFIYKSMSSYVNSFYNEEIQPVIDEIDTLSANQSNEYHVMIPMGDDFGFVRAQECFQQIDLLMDEVHKKAMSLGYDSEVKYSTLYTYFDSLKNSNLTFGKFSGDFLPYQEPAYGWNDFWTGYYSTRMHLKHLTRYVFNQLQSVKSLLVFRSVSSNKGSVRFSDRFAEIIDQVNGHIKEAERKWAILMHHDGITGTHTQITETSYYALLQEASKELDEALSIINTRIPVKMNEKSMSKIREISAAVRKNGDVIHHTLVNPTAFDRSEVMNFTVPIHFTEGIRYMFLLHNKKGEEINTNLDVKYANLLTFNTSGNLGIPNSLSETAPEGLGFERTVFVKVDIPALSEVHLYNWILTIPTYCDEGGVKCAKGVEPMKELVGRNLTNSHLNIQFDAQGNLIKYENLKSKISKDVKESITYFPTQGNTRSGLYLFNPRSPRQTMEFGKNQIWYYEMPDLKTIIQVYSNKGSTKVLKTYSIDHAGDSDNLSQLYTNVEMISQDYLEISYSLKLQESSSTYKAYADDSLKLVERPIFDPNIKVKATNANELSGYFTSACVYGGMMTEEQSQHSFSWANSNPLGCTFSGNFQVDFMLFRNIGGNDYKGVNEGLTDYHVSSTGFIFRLDGKDAVKKRDHAVTYINEPIFIISNFTTDIALKLNWLEPSHFLPTLFPHSPTTPSITIADLKLVRHTILYKYSDYEVVFVLHNRYNGWVSINKTLDDPNEGMFKNKYIDILKSKPEGSTEFKFDPKKKVLVSERYDLKTAEYNVSDTKPRGFHGLEPYEIAEFRLVSSAKLEALDIRQKQIEGKIDNGGRMLAAYNSKTQDL